MTQSTTPSRLKKVNTPSQNERLRQNLEQGALTPNYEGDPVEVIQLLNQVLATEMVCVLRYKNHYFAAHGIYYRPIAEEFLEHAKEEQEHADRIAERIHQLGGMPEFNPARFLELSHVEYRQCDTLTEMIETNLLAERIAIEAYRDLTRQLGMKDPTTRRLVEDILAKEEEHATDLSHLLNHLHPNKT